MTRQLRYDYVIFHDESGEPGRGDVFVSGLLIVPVLSVTPIRRTIRRIREQKGFWNELHWRQMSRLRAEVYEAVLTACCEHQWRYECIVVPSTRVDLSYFRDPGEPIALARARAYNRFTRLLMANRIHLFRGRTLMFSDKKERMQFDNFTDYLREAMAWESMLSRVDAELVRVILADSKRVTGLQLADLLTGMVATTRRTGASGTRKTQLAERLMQHGGLRSRIGIWDWRPRQRP